MRYKQSTLLILVFCVGVAAQDGSPAPSSWYSRVASFVIEKIWGPFYSGLQSFFFQSKGALARVAALVYLKKPQDNLLPAKSLSPSITAVSVYPEGPYEKEHARIKLTDTSPFGVVQSNPESIQAAFKVSNVRTMFGSIHNEMVTVDDGQDEITFGFLFASDSSQDSIIIAYLKRNFLIRLKKNITKGYSIEQSILSAFKAIESECKKNKWKEIVRGTGFVMKDNLIWLFGGMGDTLTTCLLKKKDDEVEVVFITKQEPFQPYFYDRYQEYRPDAADTLPDRFLGGYSDAIKPYFVAQPHITCLELQPEQQYYIVSQRDIDQDVVQSILLETNGSLQDQVDIHMGDTGSSAIVITSFKQSQSKIADVRIDMKYAFDLGDKQEMQDFLAIESNKQGVFAAVFDGHGESGFKAAQKAVSTFYSIFIDKLQEVSRFSLAELVIKYTTQALVQAGLDVDASLRAEFPYGGTTATGVFLDRRGGVPYVFNIGDSRTVIFDSNGSIIFSTHDHSIRTSNREQKRVSTMGGKFLLQKTHEGKVFISRIGSLIPSRTLGDQLSKQLPQVKGSVIAYADVIPLSLSTINKEQWPIYIVIASDGIWDFYSDKEGMKRLFERIKTGALLQDLVEIPHPTANGDNRALIVGTLELEREIS